MRAFGVCVLYKKKYKKTKCMYLDILYLMAPARMGQTSWVTKYMCLVVLELNTLLLKLTQQKISVIKYMGNIVEMMLKF